jgi:hypothetical protein
VVGPLQVVVLDEVYHLEVVGNDTDQDGLRLVPLWVL